MVCCVDSVFTLICLLLLSSPVAAGLDLAALPLRGRSRRSSARCSCQSPDKSAHLNKFTAETRLETEAESNNLQ